MNRTGLRLLGSSVLVLVLGICPMDAILSQVIMTPPTRSVETRGVTLRLPGGGQRDGRGGVRLFGDADSAKDSRVVEEALQLIPQAGLSWTASDPMVALAVAKYYLALGDEIRVPFYLLSNLPAIGGTDVDNAVTNVLNEFGGLLNFSLGVENTRLTFGKLFAFANPEEGLFFEGRLGMKMIGLPETEASDTRFAAMGQALASLRGSFPILASNESSRAGYVTLLLSLSAQYCGAEGYRSMFVDRLSPYQANCNLSGAINIARQLSLSCGLSVWASESQFGDQWFTTVTLLND